MYSLPANVSIWLPLALTTPQVHAQFVNTRFQDKILPSGWDLSERLKRLTANAKVATVLGSIPASAASVESKGRQIKQCWSKNETKIPLITKKFQARLARPTYFTLRVLLFFNVQTVQYIFLTTTGPPPPPKSLIQPWTLPSAVNLNHKTS